MDIYTLIVRPLLFGLPPNVAHTLTLKALNLYHACTPSSALFQRPYQAMGLTFPNPVGIAAGMDNNADYAHGLFALGVGFVEVGGVTPYPQPGNPLPNLFRLPQVQGLINRKGFPNKGLDYLITQLQKHSYPGIIGVNIGKNKATSQENAVNDYLDCYKQLYLIADYVTINISSPNTPGLRDLQFGEALVRILSTLKEAQTRLAEQHSHYTPLMFKVSPDLTSEQLSRIIDALLKYKIDGAIATNTSLSRQGVEPVPHAKEQGGLSGQPIKRQATAILKQIKQQAGHDLTLVGCGGIASIEDAQAKFDAGAHLVQLYTGLIYQGPSLVTQILEQTRSSRS